MDTRLYSSNELSYILALQKKCNAKMHKSNLSLHFRVGGSGLFFGYTNTHFKLNVYLARCNFASQNKIPLKGQ